MSLEDKGGLILSLPWDDIVFRDIFPRLSLQDCINLSKTSKKFERLVITYFRQLDQISPKDVKDLDLKDATFLGNNTSSIKKLDLNSVQLGDEIVGKFLANNKQLRSVNLSNTLLKETTLHSLIYCDNLKELILCNCHWVTNECLCTISFHCVGVWISL